LSLEDEITLLAEIDCLRAEVEKLRAERDDWRRLAGIQDEPAPVATTERLRQRVASGEWEDPAWKLYAERAEQAEADLDKWKKVAGELRERLAHIHNTANDAKIRRQAARAAASYDEMAGE